MELDDNSPEKSDLKAPKTIALLVKDGRFSTSYLLSEYTQRSGRLPVGRDEGQVGERPLQGVGLGNIQVSKTYRKMSR